MSIFKNNKCKLNSKRKKEISKDEYFEIIAKSVVNIFKDIKNIK